MVHSFLEHHPEGLLIETENYATNNPLPDHAVWLRVLATLQYPDKKNKRTNLVQQAPDPFRSTEFNNTPQLLQQILIFLRFLG